MAHNYSRFFSLIKQINSTGVALTKEEVIEDFTNGKTTSLKALKHFELQELERQLIARLNNTKTAKDFKSDPRDAQRKAIISQFKSIGRTAKDAIAWAEKYGVNGIKKMFNDYDASELFILTKNAEKVKSDFIKSVNKKLL
jgi:DNA modification methylase